MANDTESTVLLSEAPEKLTFASMQMTNEFWKVHMTIENDPAIDEEGYPRGLVGLFNQGNSCYMNAAIQALSNTPPLREYFRAHLPALNSASNLDNDSNPADFLTVRKPVSDAFQELIGKIWSTRRIPCIRPTLFCYKIKDRCPQFKGYTQQDAQEFIRCFLDVLHQELRHPVTPSALPKPEECDGEEASISSSCSSSQDGLNVADSDKFETPDSGLSSDTGESSKPEKKAPISPTSSPVPPKSERSRNISESAKKKDSHTAQQFRSIITEVFDGELISTVKCMTCHHLSNTTETFQDISLSIPSQEQIALLRESPSVDLDVSTSSDSGVSEDIADEEDEEEEVPSKKRKRATSSMAVQQPQFSYAYWFYFIAKSWLIDPWLSYFVHFYRFMFAGHISLEDCLYAFFSADHLHGEDMYSCEKCSKLRNGVKQCRLTRLPEVLCIHLKRFRHECAYNSKVGTWVTFPMCDLNLRPYMSKASLEQVDEKDLSTHYDLVALVSHRGTGVEYGHYIAYCRNDLDGCWYEFDDASVSPVSESDVICKEAYVLFYQKKGTLVNEEFKDRVLDVLSNIKEPNSDAYFISAEWLYRFRTFAEPGPITNSDFLCEHLGRMPLLRANQVLPIPAGVWKMLHDRYGGGPPCDRIGPCHICHKRVIDIVSRKKRELAVMQRLERSMRYATVLPMNLVSYSWFEQWEAFVNQFHRNPPGPIRNDALLQRQRDGSVRLRSGINYKTLTRDQWTYLHNIYGGGPEVFRTYDRQISPEEVEEIVQEYDEKMRIAAKRLRETVVVEHPVSDAEEAEEAEEAVKTDTVEDETTEEPSTSPAEDTVKAEADHDAEDVLKEEEEQVEAVF
uniref:Ubiquitin carboxyl-terminal hydrolase n=1 Tax=Panagrellus redivivus TaxID=6233 RepID=A0A7E4VJ70_PANRE